MTGLASRGQLRASFARWALVLVPLVLLLGFLSGRVSGSGAGNPWFDTLVKPAIYPPPATFGIVWSILYVMMGLSLTMVVTARGAPLRGAAIAVFAVQLMLNLAWSPLFFGARQIESALWLLITLDLAVLVTIVLFWRVRRAAALLLLPYFAWALFATLLNWEFLQANPDGGGTVDQQATTRFEI